MATSFLIPVDRQIQLARQIFPDLEEIGPGICRASCPGIHRHTTANGKRDFQLWFQEGKGPSEHCMHGSCEAERNDAMSALYALLRSEDPARHTRLKTYANEHAAYIAAPTGRRAPVEPFDPALAEETAADCPIAITETWLREHSPIAIPKDPASWPSLLLDNLYHPGEKILIFTKFQSQGQLLHIAGQHTLRLEEHPPKYGQIPPARQRSGFPRGGPAGVWFLASPITGEWTPNQNNRDAHGARLGRRHADCCTRYPYLVLESDEAPPHVWLRILVQLCHPVCAIYTSGGKSYHALIRVNCRTKEEFDAQRAYFITCLSALGADPAAITAVRLTRLPGCLRYGTGSGADHRPYLDPEGNPAPRMQQLLYLNPGATKNSILENALGH